MGKAHEGWELTRFLRTGSNFRGVLAPRYIHGGVVSGIIASGIELAPDGVDCLFVKTPVDQTRLGTLL